MNNLSVKDLRRIILEELERMMIQDDALFSRGDLTDIGTGTIVGLDSIDDAEDDWYVDYDEDIPACSACGGIHDEYSSCDVPVDDEADEFVGYVLRNK